MDYRDFRETGPRAQLHNATKIKWEFLQLFPVLRKIFLHAIMDISAEGGLKSIGNPTTVRKKTQQNREQSQKFSLNLKFLYATGTRVTNNEIKNHLKFPDFPTIKFKHFPHLSSKYQLSLTLNIFRFPR